MGARIRFINECNIAGEDIADIHVESSDLNGIDVPETRAPSMIDEFPILAMLAACAKGKSRLRGLRELRYKESNRFMGLLHGLTSCGVNILEEGDDLLIEGLGRAPVGGVEINSDYDHRIAMSFLVLGMVYYLLYSRHKLVAQAPEEEVALLAKHLAELDGIMESNE